MRPEVRYARLGDASIAYQVLGGKGPGLVFVPGFVSHLDLAWEEPFFARFLRGLASFSRLIWFDKRGSGLSDPAREPSTLDDAIEDIRAVMQAAGCQRAALFGVAVGARDLHVVRPPSSRLCSGPCPVGCSCAAPARLGLSSGMERGVLLLGPVRYRP